MEGLGIGWDAADDRSREELVAELERRERELAETQEIARIGSWEHDRATDAMRWSDELFRVVGLEPGSFVPASGDFFARLHPDDRAAAETAYAAMCDDGVPLDLDCRLVRPEGEQTRWVRVRGRATRDADGALLREAGTVQDVTESKEAEQGLAFLSAMAAAANDARTLQDALLAADTIVRPFTQWPAIMVSAPVRERGGELVHFEAGWRDFTDDELVAARALATRVADEPEVAQAVGPTGTVLVAGPAMLQDEVACVVVSDTGASTTPRPYELAIFGQMLALLGAVAQREEVADELATARDDALAASRAKSEFLATMSHEIRTPLNGVIGLSELLNRTELSTHQRRLADGVEQAGRSLLALVNDILDLSKVEAGKLELEEVDFDPRDVIERSAGLVAELAEAKGLELVISSADRVPALVRGDPVRFGQVITNLVSNAVKFTEVGEVVVRARGTGPDAVRVEVSDTGIGIAPEVQDKVFTAFSQADSSTTRRYGGTGLGLAICERIVIAMGGTIGVDSSAGEGSTFWFTVPFLPPSGEMAGAGATSAEDAVAGLRVLVVDDNATNRFILAEQLRAWDVPGTVAASAAEALDLLGKAVADGTAYDVALLDYMMPGTDGEQLARSIRADERLAGLRLALLSSAVQPGPEWLEDAGIDSFVSKPVLASRLLEELAVLGGRRVEESPVGRPSVPLDVVRGELLVVEDNAVNQLVATGMLHHLGFEVSIAEDGAQGVAAVADGPERFAAVLMDCQMPVMDGYDATRAIRAMGGRAARMPIIAMTASATAEEQQRCREAGMDDFVSKPVDPEVLAETLERWVPAEAPPGARSEGSSPSGASPSGAEARLRALVAEGLSPDLVLRVVERFSTSADQTLVELVAAAGSGDTAATADRAHRLRGSADNVGLGALAARLLDVETHARDGRLPDVHTLDQLRESVRGGVRELERAAGWLRQA